MTANKLPEEMVELVAIGTIPDDVGMHQPKVTRLSTGEEVKGEMVTMSRVRAVAAARRSAEKAGFIVVDVACPKCHKNSSAEHARGQREALLEALRQIDIVRGQAVDLLFCLLGRSASSTNGRIRGLDEASREVQALLARVGRHEEEPSV